MQEMRGRRQEGVEWAGKEGARRCRRLSSSQRGSRSFPHLSHLSPTCVRPETTLSRDSLRPPPPLPLPPENRPLSSRPPLSLPLRREGMQPSSWRSTLVPPSSPTSTSPSSPRRHSFANSPLANPSPTTSRFFDFATLRASPRKERTESFEAREERLEREHEREQEELVEDGQSAFVSCFAGLVCARSGGDGGDSQGEGRTASMGSNTRRMGMGSFSALGRVRGRAVGVLRC